MARIAQFPMELILPRIGLGKPRFTLQTDRGSFNVKASSTRLECLRRNQTCVRCLRRGNIWMLETSRHNPPKVPHNCFIGECPWCSLRRPTGPVGVTPHLNLYHQNEAGQLLLMTQDHIMPRHAGGPDNLSNLQTMCTECNRLKGGLLPDEWKRVA